MNIHSPIFGTGRVQVYATPGKTFKMARFCNSERPHCEVFSDGEITLADADGHFGCTLEELPGIVSELHRIHKDITT